MYEAETARLQEIIDAVSYTHLVDVSFNYLALSIIRKYVQNVLKPLKKMKIS